MAALLNRFHEMGGGRDFGILYEGLLRNLKYNQLRKVYENDLRNRSL